MSNKKKLKKHVHSKNKDIIGFVILYGVIILIVPYFLKKYTPFPVFATYFANIDIIANILSLNYPDYFHHFYDPFYKESLKNYLSFNLISIISLSGIFLVGLRHDSKHIEEKIAIMIIMSIVTFTLPTEGLPFLNKKVEDYLISGGYLTENHKEKEREIGITILLSLIFIVLEFYIISKLTQVDWKGTKNILKWLYIITLLIIGGNIVIT